MTALPESGPAACPSCSRRVAQLLDDGRCQRCREDERRRARWSSYTPPPIRDRAEMSRRELEDNAAWDRADAEIDARDRAEMRGYGGHGADDNTWWGFHP